VLMRGVDAASAWTHFLPGMIVAGIGAGLVNVPLAATAIGVVEPARAGMASGINTTFRQVGTATGVAALGSIFAGHADLAGGLDEILLVGAGIAFAAGVASLVLIRARDFVEPAEVEAALEPEEALVLPADVRGSADPAGSARSR
jgi:hypothetical protein